MFDLEDGIAILTLNDPATRNALSGDPVFSALEQAVDRINGDINIRASILTGLGPAFCSGGNVRDMRSRTGMFGGTAAQIEAQYRAGIQRIPRAFARLEVPLIAAVNGAAMGAGLDLACMCDIRIASDDAIFAENFVKVGIIAGDGGAWLLPRIIGYSRAAEMAFTGEKIDARRAFELGLVSRVVPREALLEQARALARSIAVNPPHVLRWTKRLMRAAQESSLDTVLDMAASLQALAHGTDDHAEALAATAEKRAPLFVGK
jgi:2-(1,2-epoxy-1,2-dihydrophenyl)acetyl-CoA isomerase